MSGPGVMASSRASPAKASRLASKIGGMIENIDMQAWFFLLGPLLLGLVGAMLLFNIFGATNEMTDFYEGRGDWFPILNGDGPASQGLVGVVLMVAGVITTITFVTMGVLQEPRASPT